MALTVNDGAIAHKNLCQCHSVDCSKEIENIGVGFARQNHCLLFYGVFNGEYLITQDSSFFKGKIVGSRFHGSAQLDEDFFAFAFKQCADAEYVFVVVLGRNFVHAGGWALVHVVVETRAHSIFHGGVCATAQTKGSVQ